MSKVVKIVKNCQNCQKFSKLSKIVKNVKHWQNCQKLSKLSKKKFKLVKNCQKWSKLSKNFKTVKIVKTLVRSCFLITLIKYLKGHWSLGSLFNVKKQKWLTESVSEWVSEWQGHLLSCQVTAKKCLIFCQHELVYFMHFSYVSRYDILNRLFYKVHTNVVFSPCKLRTFLQSRKYRTYCMIIASKPKISFNIV